MNFRYIVALLFTLQSAGCDERVVCGPGGTQVDYDDGRIYCGYAVVVGGFRGCPREVPYRFELPNGSGFVCANREVRTVAELPVQVCAIVGCSVDASVDARWTDGGPGDASVDARWTDSGVGDLDAAMNGPDANSGPDAQPDSAVRQPQWRRLQPQHNPGHRNNARMGYDAERNVALLIAGFNANSEAQSQTWEWNGSDWQDRTVPRMATQNEASAPRRELVFHPTTRRLISISADQSRVYSWNGQLWEPFATVSNPLSRLGASHFYDVTQNSLVAIGGSTLDNGLQVHTDLWRLDGTTWVQATNQTYANPNATWKVAYIPTRGLYWVLEGPVSRTGANRVWQWDGTVWQQLGTIPGEPRSAPIWMYMPSLDRVVMASGGLGSPPTGRATDTWTFDGSQWNQISSNSPPWAEMAYTYDSVHERLIAYGGRDAAGFSSETWVFESE